MTDRELLELAAKTAGIVPKDYEGNADYMDGILSGRNPWNPLTDDGDALRLAVRLRINIEHMVTMGAQWAGYNCWPVGRGDCGQTGDDLKRCIVRAAAEIGKSLQESTP